MRGLTLIEVLVLLVVIVILSSLIDFGVPAKAKSKAQRANCQNNLKQLGLAFRDWDGGHGDNYPMSGPMSQRGSQEAAAGTNLFRHFQVMSNELNNPKIIICPSDDRQPASSFANLANTNLSYFLSLDADETRPTMFLSGDRNLVTNGVAVKPGLAVIATNYSLGWSQKMHHLAGNIGLADGSVQQANNQSLQTLLQNAGTNVIRLAVP